MRAAIQTELDNRQFVPGQLLKGRIGWQSESEVSKVELRLFYYTKGKGTRDVEVIDVKDWTSPPPVGQETFSFNLPQGPFSFSGKLISLIWALEIIVDPGEHTERLEITLSPTGEEINLLKYPVPEDLDDESAAKKWIQAQKEKQQQL